MKKQLLVLSSLILISCGKGNDLLNAQDEIQAPKVLDKNTVIQSKTNSLTNKTTTVVMDMTFVKKI